MAAASLFGRLLNGGIFALFSAPIAKLKNVSIAANFEKNEEQKKSRKKKLLELRSNFIS